MSTRSTQPPSAPSRTASPWRGPASRTGSLPWSQLVVLAVAALGLRVAYQLELSASPLFALPFGGAAYQHDWAVALSEGRPGEGVFFHAPLYPYLLSILYELTGPAPAIARLCQAFLGALACVLLAAAGARLIARRTGLAAGWILALYPPAILFEGILKKTSLSLLLLTAFLALLARCVASPRAARFLPAGLLLGLAALTRENVIVLAPVVAIWLAVGFRDLAPARRAGLVLVFLLGTSVPLAVSALRNRAVGGAGVVATTNLGPNLYIGNRRGASGLFEPLVAGHGLAAYDADDARRRAELEAGRSLGAAEVSRHWTARAFDEVRADPLAWLGLLARKGAYLANAREWADDLDLSVFRDESLVLRVLSLPLSYGTLVGCALLGMLVAWPERRRLGWLYGATLALAASIVLVFVVSRFRLSLVPFLALFAAHGLLDTWDHLRARRIRAAVGRGLILGAALALVHLPAGPVEFPRSATYNQLGLAHVGVGRIDEGIRWFGRALDERPDNPAAHYNLGTWLLERGRHDRALRHLQAAERLEPAFEASCKLRLGAWWASQGDLEQAEALLERSRELDPTDPEVHYDLGLVHRLAGRPAAAEAAYGRALELRPDYPEAKNNLASLLQGQGRTAEAVRLWREAIAADPDFVPARLSLAWLLATDPDRRDGAAALALAREAHGLAGEEPRVLEALAAAHAAAGDFDAARVVAERLRSLLLSRRDEAGAARVEERIEAYRAGRPTTVPVD